MLANIYMKSLRDRAVSMTVAMAIVGAFLVLAMAAYEQIGIELYQDLPEAMRSVMGIPEGGSPASMAYSVVLGMVGAMTLAGLALSMGASSVAGEERDGTVGVLLGNPRSRRNLLTAKVAGMVTLVVLGASVILGAGLLGPVILGVDVGDAHIAAVALHLLLNSLVWGAMAAAAGALSGNRTFASGGTAGIMVLTYFADGLLPLSTSLADVTKVLPWYWLDGHDPLINGVAGGYAAVQTVVIMALMIVAWWGVDRRDLTRPLGSRSLVASVLDRVRQDPRAAKLMARLDGGAKISSIHAKTVAESRPLTMIVASVMFSGMGLLMGPMYKSMESTLVEMSSNLPAALLAFVGGGDMSTPEGWYQLETFGLMAPIAAILVASTIGAGALAGEEQRRTMGLLLANAVSRRTIVLQKTAAMLRNTSVVGVALFLGVAGGSMLAGLGMSLPNIAAACLQATLLGVMFGAVSLAMSAATGSVRIATLTTVGVAGTAYFANSLLSISDSFSRWRFLSPFEWYLGGDPLNTGSDWASVALFVGFTAALVAAAVALFDRRDLRRS